ncbi:transcriptional regulator NrdR [Leucothrix sargassi]|nr:transcriptional regulator NrdR [Leucothrix sargassi]
MHCPFCSATDTRVVDSRLGPDGDQVRRRRKCGRCNERFTTYEYADLNMPRVSKSDGVGEAFNVDKIRAGMMLALEKRPVSMDSIDRAIQQIKKKILSSGLREVKSQWIGERVMDELRELDGVAYIRFASVYRSFNDIDEFVETINLMEQKAAINKS